MSLYFLNSSDFFLSKLPDGNVNLCTEINDMSIVLFYSPNCKFSQVAFPIIKNMNNILRGCTYAALNVELNMQLVQTSKNTTTPIEYVPLILLYFNGVPIFKFNNTITVDNLKQFIIEVNNIKNQTQNFNNNNIDNPNIKKRHKHIDIFGEPLYGDDDKTYMEFIPAYDQYRYQQKLQNQQHVNFKK